MPLLEQAIADDGRPASGQMSRALERLAERERYLAFELEGLRYDIGEKYGVFTAQLALALTGVDQEHLLTRLFEVFAERERTKANAEPDR